MARTYTSTRNIVSLDVVRSRMYASIMSEPVTVEVTRLASGGGLRGPSTTKQTVATFTGRINEAEPNTRSSNVANQDAYNIARIYTYLTALRNNDAVDGVSGQPVSVRRGDSIEILTQDGEVQEYTAGATQEYRGHIEVELIAKT